LEENLSSVAVER